MFFEVEAMREKSNEWLIITSQLKGTQTKRYHENRENSLSFSALFLGTYGDPVRVPYQT